MKKSSVCIKIVSIALVSLMAVGANIILPSEAEARRDGVHRGGGGGGNHGRGGGGRTHVNHRSKNVNIHKNVNVNVNRHGGGGHHGGGYYRNDGRFIAGAITGIAIGSIITAASMPPSCTTTVYANATYRQCGNTWYQPQYSGTSVQYVVVGRPY